MIILPKAKLDITRSFKIILGSVGIHRCCSSLGGQCEAENQGKMLHPCPPLKGRSLDCGPGHVAHEIEAVSFWFLYS